MMTNKGTNEAHGKLLFISSAGCSENLLDGEAIKELARRSGFSITRDPGEADIIVHNSCGAIQRSMKLAITAIEHYKAVKKPDARLVVTGCLVKIDSDRLGEYFQGPTYAVENLHEIQESFDSEYDKDSGDVSKLPDLFVTEISQDLFDTQPYGRKYLEFVYGIKGFFKERLGLKVFPNFRFLDFLGYPDSLFLRVTTGCDKKCSYCGIRLSRGQLRSVSPDLITETIREAVSKGKKTLFLTGTNLTSYGRDIGSDFMELMESIIAIEGDFKIIVFNIEPYGLKENEERYLRIFCNPKILSVYYNLNSASQKVLDIMRRQYQADDVFDFMKKLQSLRPDLLIRTEFMVGHPGEGWPEFFESLFSIFRMRFDMIDVNHYSPRPRIPALKLDEQVSFPIRYLRFLVFWGFIGGKVMLPSLKPFSFTRGD